MTKTWLLFASNGSSVGSPAVWVLVYNIRKAWRDRGLPAAIISDYHSHGFQIRLCRVESIRSFWVSQAYLPCSSPGLTNNVSGASYPHWMRSTTCMHLILYTSMIAERILNRPGHLSRYCAHVVQRG